VIAERTLSAATALTSVAHPRRVLPLPLPRPRERAASTLRSTVDRQKPLATLQLRGRLNGDNVRALGTQLAELIRDGYHVMVVEMGELSEVAPVCVGVLNRTLGELRQYDGTLVLRGLDACTVQTLGRAGLHPSIQVNAA